MSRARVLEQIRRALGREPGQAIAPPPEPRIRITQTAPEDRLRAMRTAIERLAGKFYEAASPQDACRYVAERLGGAEAVASNAPFLAECGITALPNVRAGWTDPAALREACARAPFGITCADFALADTATVVLLTSREEFRLPSLLPPCHLAVIPRDRILSGLDELLAREPLPVHSRSAMVLITGPSRTGDIEQILVRGVHGPGEIHLIVV
jgi:L-lactate dehydrogenase complex protein LldG